jgi:D-beta-D-heptose 7-phosphate kinase/D-beta-D-heptose 1-phosphate adenosyltransferase
LLGFDIQQAAEISFNISYFYVTKNNNENLSYLDFYKILNTKIVDKEMLSQRNFKLVFTNGCFDAGLTAGHIECIKFAKSQGDKLVVALNNDESIRRLKGKNRPILCLNDRIDILSSIECVDFILSFEEDTPIELIKSIKPDTIVKGGDYKPGDVVGADISEVIICPTKECVTTTEKIKLL